MNYFASTAWMSFDANNYKSQIEKQLESFKLLQPGWSVMNEGETISSDAIAKTLKLFFYLRSLNFDRFEVQPGLSGELLLITENENVSIDIIINKDLTFEYSLERDGEDDLSLTDLSYRSLLLELEKLYIWNTLEFLTHDTTVNLNLDIPVWLSAPQLKTSGSPYLVQNAPFRIAGTSANTSKLTIAA